MRNFQHFSLFATISVALVSPAISQNNEAEITFWESVRNSQTHEELQAYLDAYPDGEFAPLARLRLKKLQQENDHGERGGAAKFQKSQARNASVDMANLDDPPVHDCDVLAADPYDLAKKAEGVDLNAIDAASAKLACEKALETYPGVARFQFQLGRAVQKSGSYTEAAKYYRAAAEQGYGSAMYICGTLYSDGLGVAKDHVEAVKWFRKAVSQGDADAMIELGMAYALGWGVSGDDRRAVEWFRKAAAKGIKDGMFTLGQSFERGGRIPKDYVKAIKWYRKAAEAGDTNAIARLRQLGDSSPSASSNKQVEKTNPQFDPEFSSEDLGKLD